MDNIILTLITLLFSYINSLYGLPGVIPALSTQGSAEATVQAMVEQLQLSATPETEGTESIGGIVISDRGNEITPEPTWTSLPTALPSATLTLKEMMGEPKISETFIKGSSGFGLAEGVNEDATINLNTVTGGLLVEPKMSNGWRSWRLRPPAVYSSVVEMDFAFLSCAANDQIGIIMHAPSYDEGKGYYFAIDCSGIMTLYRDSSSLGSVDASSILDRDPSHLNRLRAQINGPQVEFYLNGTKAIEVRDNTYPQGYSGFFSAPAYAGTLKALISGFYIYY